jgi:hypothetical protein
MTYPKTRCTVLVILAGFLAGGASAAQPQSPPDAPGGPAAAPPAANKRPPEAPSNVRIKAQRGPIDPSSMPTGRLREAVAAALDVQNFAPTLRAATIASRGQVITAIESRVGSAETALHAIEKSTAEMSEDGRRQFTAASGEAKAKARALRQSVEAARRANENEWDGARAQLAADYYAYAAALARIDSARGVAPPAR